MSAEPATDAVVRGLLALACDLRDEGYMWRDLEPWRPLAGSPLKFEAREQTRDARMFWSHMRQRHAAT